jgi:hypothetical protein
MCNMLAYYIPQCFMTLLLSGSVVYLSKHAKVELCQVSLIFNTKNAIF